MGQTAFVEDASYQRDFDFFFPSQARSSLTAHITDIIAISSITRAIAMSISFWSISAWHGYLLMENIREY